MSKLSERIKERRTAYDYTLFEVAEKLGVKESTMQRYESGQIKNIPYESIVTLADIFNCSPSYLMGWTDMPHDTQVKASNSDMNTPTKRIPLVGRIAAGQPIAAQEHIEDWLIVDERDHVHFALRVKGDSMTGVGIYDGDIIYVREQPTVNNGEIAVVLIDDGFPDTAEATCKRFYQYGKTVLLRPESHNPANKECEITLGCGTNVCVQGKVIFLKSYIENR